MINNFLRAGNFLLLVIIFIIALYTNNVFYYSVIAFAFLDALINHILKVIFSIPRPSNCGAAPNENGCPGCGTFADYSKPPKTSFGFPSGHAQSAAMITTLITCYLLLSQSELTLNSRILIVILWIYTFIIGMSRLYFKCHSFIQVLAGFTVGIMSGLFYYYVYINVITKY